MHLFMVSHLSYTSTHIEQEKPSSTLELSPVEKFAIGVHDKTETSVTWKVPNNVIDQ